MAGHWLRVENGLLDVSEDLGYDWPQAKSGLLAVVRSSKIVSYELRKVSCTKFVYAGPFDFQI
jgi:hypothetical protein